MPQITIAGQRAVEYNSRMIPTTTARATPRTRMTNRFRLDRTVQPLAYTIELRPDLRSFTFTGHESIALRAARPFSRITLHALELKITSAAVRRGAR